METQKEKTIRICEYWLQIKSCRQCLFEALCNYQKQNGRLWKTSSDSRTQ